MKNNDTQKNSSELVADFLNKTKLHKKEFAGMIGVTLSYVYNLIDGANAFSTRSTTLERIATVMDINPEEFIEYQIPVDAPNWSENLIMLKDLIKSNNLTTLDFLKMFERKKRLELVDILRGAKPIQIDLAELKKIAKALSMNKDELFEMWKKRMIEYLQEGGFNIENNKKVLDSMFDCAKENIDYDKE